MILTVFRSRVDPAAQQEYLQWSERIAALARTMPGYVSHKGFAAEDGERVTIVEFESAETQRAWSVHPEHRAAQQLGRSRFYTEFRIQVCEVQRDSGTVQR